MPEDATFLEASSFIGSTISWGAWGLGVWVAIHSGLLAGVVFTALSFGVNLATIIALHRAPRPVATQIAAFLTMPFFGFETLSAIGLLVQ